MNESEKRLEIAMFLLQGKAVVKPREGYDPGNFYNKEVKNLVTSALDIAQALIEKNKKYEDEEEE